MCIFLYIHILTRNTIRIKNLNVQKERQVTTNVKYNCSVYLKVTAKSGDYLWAILKISLLVNLKSYTLQLHFWKHKTYSKLAFTDYGLFLVSRYKEDRATNIRKHSVYCIFTKAKTSALHHTTKTLRPSLHSKSFLYSIQLIYVFRLVYQ